MQLLGWQVFARARVQLVANAAKRWNSFGFSSLFLACFADRLKQLHQTEAWGVHGSATAGASSAREPLAGVLDICVSPNSVSTESTGPALDRGARPGRQHFARCLPQNRDVA